MSLRAHLKALTRLQKSGVPDDLLIAALDYTEVELLDAWCAVVESAQEIALQRAKSADVTPAPEANSPAPARETDLATAEPPARRQALPDVAGAPNLMRHPRATPMTPPPADPSTATYANRRGQQPPGWVKDEVVREMRENPSGAKARVQQRFRITAPTVDRIVAEWGERAARGPSESETAGFGPAMPMHLFDEASPP